MHRQQRCPDSCTVQEARAFISNGVADFHGRPEGTNSRKDCGRLYKRSRQSPEPISFNSLAANETRFGPKTLRYSKNVNICQQERTRSCDPGCPTRIMLVQPMVITSQKWPQKKLKKAGNARPNEKGVVHWQVYPSPDPMQPPVTSALSYYCQPRRIFDTF